MEIQGDSYTFSVKDKNGFEGLYTIRQKSEENVIDFQERIKNASEWLQFEGFTPKERYSSSHTATITKQAQASTPKSTDEKCPKCGADMLMSKKGNAYCSKLCWKEKDY